MVPEYGILPQYEVGARFLDLSFPNSADDTLVEED